MTFQETLDNYLKAKKKLDKYIVPFLIENDGDFNVFMCPKCRKVFYRGILPNPTFYGTTICCDRILLKLRDE